MPRPVEEPAPKRPPYFWWLLANALALCFAVISWEACLTVFKNPERPTNYKILKRLGRLPELENYNSLKAPAAPALPPKELYRKYFGVENDQLGRMNSLLLRNYITNFERPLMLTYIEGNYRINRLKVLSKSDFLNKGIAVQAQAMVKPDDFTAPAPYPVWIEYLFPTDDANAVNTLKPGDLMEIQKIPNCAAVIHVAKVVENDEPALLLTVIPIVYGPYKVGKYSEFLINPPTELDPSAGFPVFKE
ncbi:hypothetical protein JIN85_06215 [Luteolibacter pohnpeiensis]|uniref:Uncharacterized protein n=1 Tax=Luteolibacter pohnpeiensis TaxID=454153 RepID=A0A934S730_9BACT|nr:hypothetical protein [Luteolibacter pohnpeiensis]MBK1882001.1 hypothetical protein [Luteolibacter pohnpeiensis]